MTTDLIIVILLSTILPTQTSDIKFNNTEINMTFITDKVAVKNGADYTFVCSRIPFAVSCSTHLPHEEYNLMDLDLVNKMKIPLQKIKVEKISILGQTFRSVGVVSQTVQCVHQGKISGNIHITARVVRDLLCDLDVDFIASAKTYTRLVGKKPSPPVEPMDLDDDGEDDITLDDDGDDNIIGRNCGAVAEDSRATEVETAAATKDDDPDNNKDGDEVPVGDIPWNWGREDDPNTRDESYPTSSATNYVVQARTVPHLSYGKKKYRYKSKVCSEDDEDADEMFCKLCFTTGQPLSTVKSHFSLHISCPSMTDEEKESVYGPNWVARMYGYPADPP